MLNIFYLSETLLMCWFFEEVRLNRRNRNQRREEDLNRMFYFLLKTWFCTCSQRYCAVLKGADKRGRFFTQTMAVIYKKLPNYCMALKFIFKLQSESFHNLSATILQGLRVTMFILFLLHKSDTLRSLSSVLCPLADFSGTSCKSSISDAAWCLCQRKVKKQVYFQP